MRSLIYFLLLVANIYGYKRYDGYQVLKVVPKNGAQLSLLSALEKTSDFGLDFWKRTSRIGQYAHVMVQNKQLDSFKTLLDQHLFEYSVIVENVQRLIDAEQLEMKSKNDFVPGLDSNIALDQYHSHQEINDWLDSLGKQYPSIVKISSLGKSHEGRDMKMIKIGKTGSNKNGFWIDAGIHAREWISSATSLYVINELVTKYDNNAHYKKLVDGLDFYILPSMNPDGYEYTRSDDRMWRKTRSGPHCKSTWLGKKCCKGVDGNRNWDFHWAGEGTSDDPCSDIYTGPKPFSEIEFKQVSDYLTANKDKLKAMITLHSYSEDILYPYGYQTHTYPPDVKELKELGDQAAVAVKKVHGTKYEVVNSADGLYPAAGASDDWSKHLGIKWVYTIELRPGYGDTDDDAGYGFELPAKYILRTAEEIWPGLLVMADRVLHGPN